MDQINELIRSGGISQALEARAVTAMGIDLGLVSAGCAVVRGSPISREPQIFRVQSKRKGWSRIDSQATRIGWAIERADPGVIIIEGPSFHSNGAYWHESAGLWHAVTIMIYKAGIPLAVVPPSTLKKFATGNGAASKIDMCVAAANRFGLESVNKDEADGLWLAAAGLQHYGWPMVRLPQAQVVALSKVEWPDLVWNGKQP
jgi:crossover junction endodeoxyribonuclease RuvC